LKGSSRGVIEVLSRHLPGGTVESQPEISARIIPTEVYKKAPPEWNVEKEMWRYSTLVNLQSLKHKLIDSFEICGSYRGFAGYSSLVRHCNLMVW